jgi:tRNA dimethylallyltransferase
VTTTSEYKKILVISGPTASGKSVLAEKLCARYSQTAIVNADSMQVYDALPILSAQPDLSDRSKYKLYSILSYKESCSVGLWASFAHECIAQLHAAGTIPVVVGGSGLYIQALLEGIVCIPPITEATQLAVASHFSSAGQKEFYQELVRSDPVLENKIHPNDVYRMQRAMQVLKQTGQSITSFKTVKQDYKYLHLFINPQRQLLYKNCDTRFMQMLNAGALEEVLSLSDKIKAKSLPCNTLGVEKTLGYQSLIKHLQGLLSLPDAKAEAQQLIRNYAKRQMTWFNNKFKDKAVIAYDDTTTESVSTRLFELADKFID